MEIPWQRRALSHCDITMWDCCRSCDLHCWSHMAHIVSRLTLQNRIPISVSAWLASSVAISQIGYLSQTECCSLNKECSNIFYHYWIQKCKRSTLVLKHGERTLEIPKNSKRYLTFLRGDFFYVVVDVTAREEDSHMPSSNLWALEKSIWKSLSGRGKLDSHKVDELAVTP